MLGYGVPTRLFHLPAALAILAALVLGSCEPAMGPSGKKTGLIFREFYLCHNELEGQIEHPNRLRMVMKQLKAAGLLSQLERIAPPPAPLEWILQVHTPEHLERVREACRWIKDEGAGIDTGDVGVTGRSFDVAVCAVGGILGGVDAVMKGRVQNAFCAIRPPGQSSASEDI
jgi:acetoin utilization deacetylase AcuC-like enzyme